MEHSALRIMQRLSKYDVNFTVVSVHPFGELKKLLDEDRIPSFDCNYSGPMGLFSHFKLRKILKLHAGSGPIIMTGPTLSGILAMPTSYDYPRILKVHFHHQGTHWDISWKLLYELCKSRFDFITFPSEFIRKEAVKINPSIEHMTRVVRNPISIPKPLNNPKEISRGKFGLDPNRTVIGNAGWLIKRKRFDVFLELAATVLKENNECEFIIAGDGPCRNALENQAKRLSIEQNVHFIGWKKDLTDFYGSLDILCFNSDWDALGMTPLEAMSYGIPVVASVVNGGLAEIFPHNSGLLIDSHDVPCLSRKCLSLISDREALLKEGLSAKSSIELLNQEEICVKPFLEMLGLNHLKQRFNT